MAESKPHSDDSRFTDFQNEPIDHLLSPIKGYCKKPIVPLSEAIEPVAGLFHGIEDLVFVALHNCQNPTEGLTQEESAAIHLYTMPFDDGLSLFFLLNQSLRSENREALKPWFYFLKLFLTALYKLPSKSGIVWRGVRGVDLSSKYTTGTKFAWWGVSSCTTHVEVLESDQFLGKHGLRTLFSIECINGRSISAHSYFKDAEKEIILMPGSYFEVVGQLNPAPELYIIHIKQIKPPIDLVSPPYPLSTESKLSPAIHLLPVSSISIPTLKVGVSPPETVSNKILSSISSKNDSS